MSYLEEPTPWLGLPRKPRASRIQTHAIRADVPVERRRRSNYDWKAWPTDLLPAQEAYWDDMVATYAALLPERLLADPSRVRGINLGTFNGGFQKAWMRRGYDMYGVEIADVIDELHEYGCAGHRANFFSMPEIPDDSFDFGVLDRSLCSRSFHECITQPLRERDHVTTDDEWRCSVPPFFADTMRILRPGGVLLAILYRYWSEEVLRELSTYGQLSLWLVEPRDAPLLAVRVDRAMSPAPLPDLGMLTARLDALAPGGSVDDLVRAASTCGLVGSVGSSAEHVTMHFVTTNHLVNVAPDTADSGCRIVDSTYWAESEHAVEFFGEPLTLEAAGGADDARGFVLLAARRGGALEETLTESLADHCRVLRTIERTKGTASVARSVREIGEALSGGVCLLQLGTFDSSLTRRRQPRVPLEQHLENLRHVIEGLRDEGCVPVFLDAFPRVPTEWAGDDDDDDDDDDDERLDEQNDIVARFNREDRVLMRAMDVPIVETSDPAGWPTTWFRGRGEHLGRRGARAVVREIAKQLEAILGSTVVTAIATGTT